ncbi:MAG TPA: PPOX class F420-dependent oxidoreductase [Acidimicrobiales bacterium]|nr:PPOX class F420-dependent oxidoreductase [Acidimicrobiales bacterium]
MSVFTPAEIEYLHSQRLARLATTGLDCQPHVVPVSFRYNAEHDSIDIGGHDFAQRWKFRQVQQNPKVAVVVDDLVSVDPWTPRAIEVRGEASILGTGGKEIMPGFDDEMFRITPRQVVSWGVDAAMTFRSRRVGA